MATFPRQTFKFKCKHKVSGQVPAGRVCLCLHIARLSSLSFFARWYFLAGARARMVIWPVAARTHGVLRQKQVMVRAPGLFRWQASTGGGCMHALVLQLFSIKSICLSHSSRGLRAKVTQSVCASVKVHGHQANVIHAFPSTTTTPIGG